MAELSTSQLEQSGPLWPANKVEENFGTKEKEKERAEDRKTILYNKAKETDRENI